jgi:hypothetical protein
MVFIFFKSAWFSLSTSMFLTYWSAIFFGLWSKNSNFSGRSFPTLPFRQLNLDSWIFQDLLIYLSKHSLLLTGIARNILQYMEKNNRIIYPSSNISGNIDKISGNWHQIIISLTREESSYHCFSYFVGLSLIYHANQLIHGSINGQKLLNGWTSI